MRDEGEGGELGFEGGGGFGVAAGGVDQQRAAGGEVVLQLGALGLRQLHAAGGGEVGEGMRRCRELAVAELDRVDREVEAVVVVEDVARRCQPPGSGSQLKSCWRRASFIVRVPEFRVSRATQVDSPRWRKLPPPAVRPLAVPFSEQ